MKFVSFFDPKSEINFPRYFRSSLWIALIIPLICLVGMLTLGFNWGIDFKGGTEMQILFGKEVKADEIRGVLEGLGFHKHQVQSYGPVQNHEMLIRVEKITPFSDADIKKMADLVNAELALPSGSVEAYTSEDMGDRVTIKLPVPEVSNPQDV
jgi:preprotein translocase subunit SecF